jgi:hypothetical protein
LIRSGGEVPAWAGVLAEGTVRPGSVVVPQVLAQYMAQMVLVDDQQPVEEFSASLGRRRRLEFSRAGGRYAWSR